MALRDLFRGLDGYIKNADQFDAAAPGKVRIDARMLLSERTGAEHRDLDLWQHGRGSFRLAEVRGKSAVRRIKKAGKSGVAEHSSGYKWCLEKGQAYLPNPSTAIGYRRDRDSRYAAMLGGGGTCATLCDACAAAVG